MIATLSSKGQIVLNANLRRVLGLTPGMKFEVRGESDRIEAIGQNHQRNLQRLFCFGCGRCPHAH